MSPRFVKLSRRYAQALLDYFDNKTDSADIEGLRDALKERKPVKRYVKKAQARKTAKRATKKEETKAIREVVFARSQGFCELCKTLPSEELHHAFGRVKVKQSDRNTIAICRPCHRGITDNLGGADFWANAQWGHFARYGFAEESRAMNARCESLELEAQQKFGVGGAK